LTITQQDQGWQQAKIPAPAALDLAGVMAIYEMQRRYMPQAVSGGARQAGGLIDILAEFDALILDGYGVINVGNGLVAGIDALLGAARQQNKPVVVLTNGGSFEAGVAAQKYADWDLPIAAAAVVSSRDAMVAASDQGAPAALANTAVIGCLGGVVTPLPFSHVQPYENTENFWQTADAFAFLGAIDWTIDDQTAFEAALIARPRPVFVANPDVAAPHEDRFSTEPGYWMARVMQVAKMPVRWYGKPYRPAFAMALDRLQKLAGRNFDRRRVAMVGDSLHTDILGGGAAGLQTVLITGAGLFREGGATQFIAATGIQPDWIVPGHY